MTIRNSLLFLAVAISSGYSKYVDTGNPYKDGPLQIGELTLSKTTVNSPLHTKVYFPLRGDSYPVVYFIGGLGGYVLTEFYEIFLSKVASHGFFVFGVDRSFPVLSDFRSMKKSLDDIADEFFNQLQWLKSYMSNKTTSRIMWEKTGLLCHSAGCDITLEMILKNHTMYTSTIFLEPFSSNVKDRVPFIMPAFMYGTQLSEEGLFHCALKGEDWDQFYEIWKCPRIKMEAADFGHCDILDPVPWEACHTTHFCTTTNNTRLPQYRQFVQGAVSSFLIYTLQGLNSAVSYISAQGNIPLKVLDHMIDLNCTAS